MPANRADEQFGAAILVKKHDAGRKLSRLRQQEIEDHGFPRSRWTDDGEIPQIILVKVEKIGSCCGRFKQCDSIPPMIAAWSAYREIVQAGEPCEIAGRNQSFAHNIFEVAGKLRPECGFQPDILTDSHDPQIGKHRCHFGDLPIKFVKRAGVDRDAVMMLAKSGPAGSDLILGIGQLIAQR